MRTIKILKGARIGSSYGTMEVCATTPTEDELNILADTGHFSNRYTLISELRFNEVKLKDIDKMLFTYLNWGHCLNVGLIEDSEILLSKKEYDMGTLTGVNDDFSSKSKELRSSFNMIFINEGFKISSNRFVLNIHVHVSLVIKNESKMIIIAYDVVPNLRAYGRGIPYLIFYNMDLVKKSKEKTKNFKSDKIDPSQDLPFNFNGYVDQEIIDIILRSRNETNTVLNIYMIKIQRKRGD